VSYKDHGWRHHPTKGTDPIEVTASGADFYTSPVVIPILMNEFNTYDGFGWTWVTVDSTVRYGAVRTNAHLRTPAVNDYLTHGVTLGPTGSIWGLSLTYKGGPDCGKIQFALGSVATPNPNRAGVSDEATLTEDIPTYINLRNGLIDTYNSSASDVSHNGLIGVFRMMGAAGDPFTAISVGADAYTLYDTIDGGPGFYRLRAKVTDKNASSSGYRAEITGLAYIRLDDAGSL